MELEPAAVELVPGQVALVPVTYIEERRGLALVRLPNGSKTSVQFDALDVLPARGHFVPAADRTGGRVFCLECDVWATSFIQWSDGVAGLSAHWAEAHGA